MSEQVAIIYNRFMDKQFLVQTVQLMILNEKNEEKDFGKNQFRMLKVRLREIFESNNYFYYDNVGFVS